jgi:hypothetical protein
MPSCRAASSARAVLGITRDQAGRCSRALPCRRRSGRIARILLPTLGIVALITRMPRNERPPIQADIRAETVRFDKPLRGVVATLAQALERTKPGFVDIAVMRLDVIADFCGRDDTALETECAQRMFPHLVPSDSGPASRGVPLVPLRRSAANAHGFLLSPSPREGFRHWRRGPPFYPGRARKKGPMPVLDQSVELQEFCALNTRR